MSHFQCLAQKEFSQDNEPKTYMKSNWLSAIILLTFQIKSSKQLLDHPFESFCHNSVLAITTFYIKITSTQLKFRLFSHIPDVVQHITLTTHHTETGKPDFTNLNTQLQQLLCFVQCFQDRWRASLPNMLYRKDDPLVTIHSDYKL